MVYRPLRIQSLVVTYPLCSGMVLNVEHPIDPTSFVEEIVTARCTAFFDVQQGLHIASQWAALRHEHLPFRALF